MIAAPGAAAGIARLLGARVVTPPGATGRPGSDLAAKAAAALAALEDGAERIVVHVGGPDEAAHELDTAAKVAAIEAADRDLIAPLAAALRTRGSGLLRVCPDHGCDPADGRHDPAPVPCVAWAATDAPRSASAAPPDCDDRAAVCDQRAAPDGARGGGAAADAAGRGDDARAGGGVIPRVVIAGTSSGAGKTTVASGLIGALRGRGLRVQGFKVGPDYIDPSYHALASGRPGRNLDAYLAGTELIAPLFRHGSGDADIAVIEGVMGLFDGASGRGELASTAQVAKLLHAPVVLVVDGSAMARSAAAIVHGFASFDPQVDVAGVIFNRVGSDIHEQLLREAVEPLGLPVLGALRRDERITAPERHLGLVPVAEREPRTRDALDLLAATLAERVELDALLALAHGAPAPAGAAWSPHAGDATPPARMRGSRSPAGRRSPSTTRRTSSCSRRRGRSCCRSTRCATRRCPRAPTRSCSRAASRRSSARSWRRTRACAGRSPRMPPPAARSSPNVAGCCSSASISTVMRCAEWCR